MPIHLALFLLAQPSSPVFDQSVAAFRARKSFSVTISLDAMMNKTVTTARYRLSFQAPSKVLLTKLVNGHTGLIFWLDAARFIAYDPSSAEMTVRKAPKAGPIVNRLANAVGGIEDPVSAQLSPDTMATFLSPFKQLKGWTTKSSNGNVLLTRPGTLNGKKTLTEFEFDAKSKLLTRALLIGPASKLQWVFVYGPAPKNLVFSPPKGTRTVASLSEHAHVNASDTHARNLVDASLRAYSRLTSVAFSVTGSTGASTDWMSGSSFREKNSVVDWSYRRGVLTLHDLRKNRTYRGRTKASGILSYLKILKAPVDPMLQAWIQHRNPISGWFLPGMVVSSHGSVQIGSAKADAVEIGSKFVDVSLLIRRDNYLVQSVSSRAKDPHGRVLDTAHRDITYLIVNKPIAATSFVVAGSHPLPLTKIGKQ